MAETKRVPLPIGRDDFRVIREGGFYFVDKTPMIADLLGTYGDAVTLITRPRRFGKTLNMTMLREFFDISKDSRAIFDGLAIMDSEYASLMNSQPVVYLTLKDCSGSDAENLRFKINYLLYNEFFKYVLIFNEQKLDDNIRYTGFYRFWDALKEMTASFGDLAMSLLELLRTVTMHYGKKPLLLIDEYDTPLLSSYERGYKDEVGDFFTTFYGSSLKGNEYLDRAVLTGIQRVAKESIFSKLNNVRVYTVLDEPYSQYFGLTERETETLLASYGLELNAAVKLQYDGYDFGGTDIYNPWSVLNYADTGRLEAFWVNTSSNTLVRTLLAQADEGFRRDYEELLETGSASVPIRLQTSFMELGSSDALWGLLVNAGYLTITDSNVTRTTATVRIPNGEVRHEFMDIVSSAGHMGDGFLAMMFDRLINYDIEGFTDTYSRMVLNSTSYHDNRENAYHMLFLGMCLSLIGLYKVTSNLEAGLGRSDITLESLNLAERPHMVIEFKQGEDVAALKQEALEQIIDKRYFAPLTGEVLCLGVAHNGKACQIAHQVVQA